MHRALCRRILFFRQKSNEQNESQSAPNGWSRQKFYPATAKEAVIPVKRRKEADHRIADIFIWMIQAGADGIRG
jgi:hypothetical protein